MASVEEVEKLFESKIKELNETLPQKYTRNVMTTRNCAAWTVASILDILKIDDLNIINMASPLAGIADICGAVNGGLMMVGLIAGNRGEKEIPQFIAAAEGVKFVKYFEREFKTSKCQELCGYDLLTTEGMQNYIKENVWGKQCYKQVVKAVELIGKLYKKKIVKII